MHTLKLESVTAKHCSVCQMDHFSENMCNVCVECERQLLRVWGKDYPTLLFGSRLPYAAQD